jgi:hypothetical protein
LQRDVQVIITTTQNESLPLPVVSLMHTSLRNQNSSAVKPSERSKLSLSKNREKIPDWAYIIPRNLRGDTFIAANVVNYANLDKNNLTLHDAKQKWPLTTNWAGSNGGIILFTRFNATNFIDKISIVAM